jgi:hypothetical protein
MQNAETIYQQTILPLPDSEKLHLATLILQNLGENQKRTQSALDLLQNLEVAGVFASPHEVDGHLKAERESWDN